MSVRRRLVAALLRIYPFEWRREYGSELADVLLDRPLGTCIVADVFWNGLRERARSLEPSTVLGFGMMLVVLAGLAWNIFAPRPYAEGWTVLLEPSSKTLPTIDVRPLTSELYLLFLLSTGCWLHLRRGGEGFRKCVMPPEHTRARDRQGDHDAEHVHQVSWLPACVPGAVTAVA